MIPSLFQLRPGVTAQVRASIRTTNISNGSAVLSARSAVALSRSGLGPGEADVFDLPPPAYSAVDMARSPLRLNGDAGGIGGE